MRENERSVRVISLTPLSRPLKCLFRRNRVIRRSFTKTIDNRDMHFTTLLETGKYNTALSIMIHSHSHSHTYTCIHMHTHWNIRTAIYFRWQRIKSLFSLQGVTELCNYKYVITLLKIDSVCASFMLQNFWKQYVDCLIVIYTHIMAGAYNRGDAINLQPINLNLNITFAYFILRFLTPRL
jgi:hypothetical protein